MKSIRRIAKTLLLIVVILLMASIIEAARSEDATVLYVKTRLLNGRSAPRKTASVEALFDYGDSLDATGEWSSDHLWVEVRGGETGTVWVHIRYVSERSPYEVTNEKHKTIKIRKRPFNGKVVGYVKKGQKIVIEQKIFNWGRTKKGWVDLDYFVEED